MSARPFFFALLAVTITLAAAVVTPAGATPTGEWPAPTFDTVANLDELTGRHATTFRLYDAFFLRSPDAEGALYWVERVDRCLPLATVADQFASGSEFRNRYGSMSDEAFVQRIYQNVLGRAGDPDGLDYWTARVVSGRLTRGEMVLWVSMSNEFRRTNPYPSDDVPDRACRPATGPATARTVHLVGSEVLATVGDLEILAPAPAIERVGFHQSTHPGAQAMTPNPGASFPTSVMAGRNRDTAAAGAADVVVHPSVPITAPVSGTVKRGGGYTLYCRYSDGFVVITPDANPALELKVLHMQEVSVTPGQRVEAGDRIGAHATVFPFRSQVDDLTAEPSWPHVHIELVDPSIPRKPSSGGC